MELDPDGAFAVTISYYRWGASDDATIGSVAFFFSIRVRVALRIDLGARPLSFSGRREEAWRRFMPSCCSGKYSRKRASWSRRRRRQEGRVGYRWLHRYSMVKRANQFGGVVTDIHTRKKKKKVIISKEEGRRGRLHHVLRRLI